MDENQLFQKYNEWFTNRTSEEYELQGDILEYEDEYFEDITFKEGSICYEIAKLVFDTYDNFYLDLGSRYYRYYVSNELEENICGTTNLIEHTIIISKKCRKDKSAILHEMLHAYEYIVQSEHPILCEVLLLALYNKLKSTVPNLDELIKRHSELYGQFELTEFGGYHGVLFYLKSLDLDIRCGYKLGTVCGYGRNEY